MNALNGSISLREIFDQIVDLAPQARAAHADTLTGDAALKAEALALACASDIPASLATQIAAPLMEIAEGLAGPELRVGDTLGQWQLLQELGHGGMGAVFFAKRSDGQFDQRAAIKILQGMASKQALLLLAKERQILANFSHSNIARLLDGGATPKGRPYLVMEYIDGMPLDEYVKHHALPLKARLKLFGQICQAAAFAHTQLVVHCDLKPSNVVIDKNARAVLLDFGIATLMESSADTVTNATDVADVADVTDVAIVPVAKRHAFTPRYASPELKASEAVGTATDVYSLGIILRELIADCKGANAAGASDLNAIIALATQVAPPARYKSVALFAQDIENYLNHFPVTARPNSRIYTLRKLVRRRWPAFVVASVAVVTLSIFTVRIAHERNVAKQEAATAERVTEFVVSLLEGADPDRSGRQDATALSLFDQGHKRIATELKDQPVVQSRLYEKLAILYDKIGQTQQAAALFDSAIAVERKIIPPQHARLSSLLIHAALFKSNERIAGPAEAEARESLALREQFEGLQSPLVAQSQDMLALIISADGNHTEAEALMRRALVIRELRKGVEPDDDLAGSHHNLGVLFKRKQQFAQSIEHYRIAADFKAKRFGMRHPRYLHTMEQLAETLTYNGQTDEAEKILRNAIILRREIHGNNSARVAHALRYFGGTMIAKGNFAEAMPALNEALALYASTSGPRSAAYANALVVLAEALQLSGAQEAAEKAYADTLAISIEVLLPTHLALANAQFQYGKFLLKRNQSGDLARAKALLVDAENIQISKLASDDLVRMQSTIAVATAQISGGDFVAAAARINQIFPFASTLHPRAMADFQQAKAQLAGAQVISAQNR